MKGFVKLSASTIAGIALLTGAISVDAADITLKYGGFGSGKSPFYMRAIDPWIARVAKETGGKVEVKKYVNTLGGPGELYKNTRDGIADIAWVTGGAQRGFKFPRTEVMSLPLILDGYSNKDANVALWRLYEQGLISPDYSDVVPIGFASMSPGHIVTKDSEPTLDQLKGMKIAVTGGITAQVAKSLGAIPVFTQVNALYQSLSRKTVDGMLVGLTAIKPFRLDEVTNRHILVPMDSPLVFIGMNKRKLNSLPGDARAAFLKASNLQLSTGLGRTADGMVAFTAAALRKNPDQKLIAVSAAQKAPWRAAVKPVVDHWVKSTPNGAAILAAYKKELKASKMGK